MSSAAIDSSKVPAKAHSRNVVVLQRIAIEVLRVGLRQHAENSRVPLAFNGNSVLAHRCCDKHYTYKLELTPGQYYYDLASIQQPRGNPVTVV